MGGLVSGVSSLMGGGANNSGFQAQSTYVAPPVDQNNLNAAYGQAQSAVGQQQDLANALAGQNGIQNQSNVYNQLQGVANGTGPNPAAAQLAQATSANTANQAALMAGQRGSGANVGLLARQAAQVGAANQQNSIGQAATLQSQQQLNALGQLGGLSTQQVAQQQNAVSGLNSAAQGLSGQALNSYLTSQGQAVQQQGNINSTNAALAAQNAKTSSGFLGGALNGIGGGVLSGVLGGGGGDAGIGGLVGGGDAIGAVGQLAPLAMLAAEGGMVPNPKVEAVASADRFKGALAPHIEHMARIYHPQKFAAGGKVNAIMSPGEVYLSPGKAKEVAKDGKNPIKEGEKIPGKPKVSGNSYENDVVPKKLEEGGVVIPNSIMQSEDPAGAAADFVKKLVEKNGSKEHGDFKMALKKAIASRKAS